MILVFKLLLAPSLVALASLAGRRWGLRVGGAIGGFPVVVGPILLFFALEQGVDFAAAAAVKSLWGVLPFVVFCSVMSWSSLRLPLWVAVLLGWTAFMGVSFWGLHSGAGLGFSAALALASNLIGIRLLPPTPGKKAALGKPWRWDIPARMAATLSLVLGLTAAARSLGPDWSGALAPFPVASTILGSFAYVSDGPRGPAALFKGSLSGSYAYGSFCGVLALCLPLWGLWPAFAAAFGCALAVQIAALFLMTRKN